MEEDFGELYGVQGAFPWIFVKIDNNGAIDLEYIFSIFLVDFMTVFRPYASRTPYPTITARL